MQQTGNVDLDKIFHDRIKFDPVNAFPSHAKRQLNHLERLAGTNHSLHYERVERYVQGVIVYPVD